MGLSLMGGAGLLSTALVLPWLGQLYDIQLLSIVPEGFSVEQLRTATDGEAARLWSDVKFTAGAYTLRLTSMLPGVLIVAFVGLHLVMRRKKKQQLLATAETTV